MPTLTLLFGEQENRDWNQEDIDWNSIDRNLVSEHIVVTQAEINGKRLGSLHLRNTYDINISACCVAAYKFWPLPTSSCN